MGLRNSFLTPAEIYFVDDGSTPENVSRLEQAADRLDISRTTIVRNATNLGLAGARNVALARVRTPYVCAHDNDNILLNRFLDLACRILDENSDVAAVTTWLCSFEDETAWQAHDEQAYMWRPLGPDLGFGLRENVFDDACAVYRTETLRRFGGWDSESKAMWEDWQLFIRLTAAGEQIWVVPKELFLYRIRPTAMSRTYPEFPARLRVARPLGLPRNQTGGLIRAALTPLPMVQHELDHLRWEQTSFAAQMDAARAEKAELATALANTQTEVSRLQGLETALANTQAEVSRLQAIEQSTIWRVSGVPRRWFARHQRIRRVVRRTLFATARALRSPS